MSEEETLDYIPEDLSDENKQRLRELTVESEPEPASLEVNEYLIRHWCETLEDGNPLYMDADYARSRGFRSVVAPPGSFMTAFAMPFRWPWPPGGREPAPHIHYDIKEALDLPVGIINKIDVEMGVPLQVGDRLSVSQRLVSVSPPKKTRLGEGHFWTMDRIYRNQHGELVARERMSAFGYGREGETQQAAAAAGGGWSPAPEPAGPDAELGEAISPCCDGGNPVAIVEAVQHDTGRTFARIAARPTAKLDRSREVLLVWPGDMSAALAANDGEQPVEADIQVVPEAAINSDGQSE